MLQKKILTIGVIVLLVFLVQEGSFDRNEYGPSPKKAPAI